jgi:polyisoprenoid-binding protein YceI
MRIFGKLKSMTRWQKALLAATATLSCVVAAQEEVYTVDASASDIHWRIYKAGTFSRFGHNHVISVADFTGTVTRADDIAASTFELVIPVESLVVDDPMLRANYGEDFSSVPTPEDIAGTHRNMLSADVLDAANHPMLVVRGKLASGSLETATFALTIELLGRSVEVSAPGAVEVDGDSLVASGEFRVTHADLGMSPFSVMLGALAVAEPLDISYRIEARRAEGPEAALPGPGASGEAAAPPLPRPLR